MGEDPTNTQLERMQWVSSPGNYGGSWCSPAPLYRYLSQKDNDLAPVVDMSSFEFVISCGVCHPGGGSLEHDRDGLRYDQVMLDPANGFTSGETNNLDGDYHKSRWSESGVIEADCNICHLPGYNNTGRLGAPVAKHTWLPPVHLDKIACQTCHIPERTVKSAQFVTSDVFNPGCDEMLPEPVHRHLIFPCCDQRTAYVCKQQLDLLHAV